MDVVGHQHAAAAEAAQVDDRRAALAGRRFDRRVRHLDLAAGPRPSQVERDRQDDEPVAALGEVVEDDGEVGGEGAGSQSSARTSLTPMWRAPSS